MVPSSEWFEVLEELEAALAVSPTQMLLMWRSQFYRTQLQLIAEDREFSDGVSIGGEEYPHLSPPLLRRLYVALEQALKQMRSDVARRDFHAAFRSSSELVNEMRRITEEVIQQRQALPPEERKRFEYTSGEMTLISGVTHEIHGLSDPLSPITTNLHFLMEAPTPQEAELRTQALERVLELLALTPAEIVMASELSYLRGQVRIIATGSMPEEIGHSRPFFPPKEQMLFMCQLADAWAEILGFVEAEDWDGAINRLIVHIDRTREQWKSLQSTSPEAGTWEIESYNQVAQALMSSFMLLANTGETESAS